MATPRTGCPGRLRVVVYALWVVRYGLRVGRFVLASWGDGLCWMEAEVRSYGVSNVGGEGDAYRIVCGQGETSPCVLLL